MVVEMAEDKEERKKRRVKQSRNLEINAKQEEKIKRRRGTGEISRTKERGRLGWGGREEGKERGEGKGMGSGKKEKKGNGVQQKGKEREWVQERSRGKEKNEGK